LKVARAGRFALRACAVNSARTESHPKPSSVIRAISPSGQGTPKQLVGIIFFFSSWKHSPSLFNARCAAVHSVLLRGLASWVTARQLLHATLRGGTGTGRVRGRPEEGQLNRGLCWPQFIKPNLSARSMFDSS
jgi:hypothetical protein